MIQPAQQSSPGAERETDVCIIVEGCYPFIAGGVSGWIDWLMRTQTETSFSVVALWPRPTDQPPRYALPPNVSALHRLYLQDFGDAPSKQRSVPGGVDELARVLNQLVNVGGIDALKQATARLEKLGRSLPLEVLFNSPVAWQLVQRMYAAEMPYGSFLHYFWAWRALLGGLFSTLTFKLPRARVYHTISTGYAGVLAARAALETGRPSLLTEHGIYTNERRIELLMADWVADTIDKGHALEDPRLDLRDMWVRAFEAYARTCYEGATEIVTLYQDNQRAQRLLGASSPRMRVIANGIDLKRFAGIAPPAEGARPTMALIGRVVPIKDVKTYIAAANILRRKVGDLRAWILGPTDEDPDYVDECKALVRDLQLDGCVEFTGAVNIVDYLAHVHVVVLTSLSESQPLVVLEAGAAGIPFVATNVGSCREIIEGRDDEQPRLGRGGIVTDLVAPDQTAEAVHQLIVDGQRRGAYGAALKSRVEAYYTSEQAAQAYRELYRRLVEAPSREPARERV